MYQPASVFLGSLALHCIDWFYINDTNDTGKFVQVYGLNIADAWYHIAAVYENTTLSIYQNGTLSRRGSGLIASSTLNTVRERNFIGMGEISNETVYVSNTVLDEIKLYNKALTPEQVQLDMNVNEKAGIC
jgi:hypothetical protein